MKSSRFGYRGPAVACALIAIALSAAFVLLHERARHSEFFPNELGTNAPCPGKVEETTMSDQFLPGVIAVGEPTTVTWNWYACHPPRHEEIALLRISKSLPPHPRVIYGIPGDSILIEKNDSGSGWTLRVNDRVVRDSHGHAYTFGGDGLPPLGRYIETQGKILGRRDVIVLSTRSPGEADSGQFGVMGIDDLVAKVEPRKTSK